MAILAIFFGLGTEMIRRKGMRGRLLEPVNLCECLLARIEPPFGLLAGEGNCGRDGESPLQSLFIPDRD